MKQRKRKLGKAFPDSVLKTNTPFGHFNSKKVGVLENNDWQDLFVPGVKLEVLPTSSIWRSLALGIFILIIFFGIFLKLFQLQIISGSRNRELADFNRIQMKIIHAPRGVIYDRQEQILAENNPGFRLNGKVIDRDEALKLEVQKSADFEKLEVDSIRHFPKAAYLSHILGYVGEISPEELKNPEYKNYRPGDRIGRAGIESQYEQVLKGKDGAEIIEVDAAGKILRTIRRQEPIPGKNIYLSIDTDLQKLIFNLLKNTLQKAGSCCGAVVAVDPNSGEILSMVSLPEYDANAFTDSKRSSEVSKYFNDSHSPMLNRVIGGTYPPGSTFKIVSALAGLSSNKINAKTTFEDTGVINIGPYSFSNWYFTSQGGKDGWVDVVKALQRSNDIYFYRLGEKIGETQIGDTAKKLLMGTKIGIDLPGEATGLVPEGTWKEKNIGDVWYPGDTLHMAIGQGYLLTTPLQILAATSFIAENGKLYQPHLVTKITNPDNSLVKQFDYKPLLENLFKKENIEVIKAGLELVPKEGGTAWPFFGFTLPTAGKTGTAEFGDPKNKTHAWYTSYAPSDDPKIVVTALVEGGGEGSTIASPIVKDIYTWFFSTDKSHLTNFDSYKTSTSSARMIGE